MHTDLDIDLTEGVLTLTLARPAKKNALTNEMYGALADAIAGAATDAEVRVVLIQGDGDLFTAGNDMAEFAAQAVGKGRRNAMSRASCTACPTRWYRSWQRSRARRSVSVPRCCSIATTCCWPRAPN